MTEKATHPKTSPTNTARAPTARKGSLGGRLERVHQPLECPRGSDGPDGSRGCDPAKAFDQNGDAVMGVSGLACRDNQRRGEQDEQASKDPDAPRGREQAPIEGSRRRGCDEKRAFSRDVQGGHEGRDDGNRFHAMCDL